jgi:hypothetical protein
VFCRARSTRVWDRSRAAHTETFPHRSASLRTATRRTNPKVITPRPSLFSVMMLTPPRPQPNNSSIHSSRCSIPQGVSKRVMNASNNKYSKNIHKRGLVDIHAKQNAKDGFAVGPVMLGFFIFVVVGSSLLQIIKTATSGGPAAGA